MAGIGVGDRECPDEDSCQVRAPTKESKSNVVSNFTSASIFGL